MYESSLLPPVRSAEGASRSAAGANDRVRDELGGQAVASQLGPVGIGVEEEFASGTFPEDDAMPTPRADMSEEAAEAQPSRLVIDWPVAIWIGGIHLLALAAPFFFTWSGFAICMLLYWVTGGLGVCLGYHRLLTHGSFQTTPLVRFVFAFLGGVSGEGSALVWVSNHRKHHAFSDQPGDPHSPRDGGWWAHMLWLFPLHTADEVAARANRWAPDLVKDRGIVFLHSTFLLWHFLIGGALLASGWMLYDRFTGISWLIWGLAVRMVIVFHVTWLVNSATHMWGYRNYETTDDSKNLWWVGLLAFGEGWHNNHHAYQRMARHGHRWWEVDTTYWVILCLERVGLSWNVVHDVGGRRAEASKRPVERT
ncbi:MAG: acyl-CoA desaturase [Planctomycetaceae bacterium]